MMQTAAVVNQYTHFHTTKVKNQQKA